MITYLAYVAFGFLGIQLCNVLVNYIFRQRIPSGEPLNDRISILIPARNEEANIGRLLGALRRLPDHNVEILVYDDHSTDRTAQIVWECSNKDARVALLEPSELPQGWLGKNHACYQLAQRASGRYLLFLDADVILNGDIARDAVEYMRRNRIGLLSIFPKQQMLTLGEKCAIPLMSYILLTLLPLILVRYSPFSSHAAANGQFMLFDAEIYRNLQPHLKYKASAVEDIAISRYYKRQRIPMVCTIGEPRVQCRMYASYDSAVDGFSKNIFMFFGGSPLLAAAFWLLAALGIVPVLAFSGLATLLYLLGLLLVLLLYSATCKQNALDAIILFPAHLRFMLQVMVKSLKKKRERSYQWKGRNIYS